MGSRSLASNLGIYAYAARRIFLGLLIWFRATSPPTGSVGPGCPSVWPSPISRLSLNSRPVSPSSGAERLAPAH